MLTCHAHVHAQRKTLHSTWHLLTCHAHPHVQRKTYSSTTTHNKTTNVSIFWLNILHNEAQHQPFHQVQSLEAALQFAGALRSAAWNQNATHSTVVASSVRTGIAPPAGTPHTPKDCVVLPWVDWCPEPLLLLAVGLPAGLLLGIAVGWSCYRRCDAWRVLRTRVIPIRDKFEGNSRVAELTDEFPHLFDGSNHPVQLKVAWK